MRTCHCPLCGLRFAHVSELDAHARDEHAPPAPRREEHLVVSRARGDRPKERPLQLPW